MFLKNVFSLLCSASLILMGTQQIHAQTYKTGQMTEAIQIRERLFKERQRLEQQFPDSRLSKSGSTEKIQVSDGQVVYRYVSAVAISPNFASDHTIIAAVTNTGLFRSKDSGMTWEPLNNGLEYKALFGQIIRHNEITINFIAFSPNYVTDNSIFVGAEEEVSFKSENKGDAWHKMGGYITSIAFSPNYRQDSTIYVSGWMNYSISRNGGKTWKSFPKPPTHTEGRSDNYMYDINLSPFFDTDSTVFLSSELGYFKSTNGGKSWNQL
ncbi:hypothetical protein L0244_05620, partial [bacterium]|nr:hypothetical protein [bacterium]